MKGRKSKAPRRTRRPIQQSAADIAAALRAKCEIPNNTPGLSPAPDACNADLVIKGANGVVVLYCTNDVPCGGSPHAASVGEEQMWMRVQWRAASDVADRARLRTEAAQQKATQLTAVPDEEKEPVQ